MSKITKEQLQKIQEQQSKLQSILVEIGVMEVRKHEATHAQSVLSQEIEATKKELEEEYGAVNINMQDGSYANIEKEEDDDSDLTVVKSEN